MLRLSRADCRACWRLGGAITASYAGECDAVYSVVDGYGKLSVPCVQLDEGSVYQAQLDQVRGAKQFLFKLKTLSVVDHSVKEYGTFDSKTGQLFLPVVETNLIKLSAMTLTPRIIGRWQVCFLLKKMNEFNTNR